MEQFSIITAFPYGVRYPRQYDGAMLFVRIIKRIQRKPLSSFAFHHAWTHLWGKKSKFGLGLGIQGVFDLHSMDYGLC